MTTSGAWKLLGNGHILHASGVELQNRGGHWRMTEASGLVFVLHAMRALELSAQEARDLADALILEGASWAMRLH